MSLFLFASDFGVEDQFLGVITQRLSRVLEFDAVGSLFVDEFPDLCDELTGPL